MVSRHGRQMLRRAHVAPQGEGAQQPNATMRRVLVYGAGVLGSLYAGKLHQAGYDVTLLARGQRLEELRERGLILVEESSGKREEIHMPVIDRLDPDDAYDLVLVVVRKNQIPSVLPSLAANRGTPNVLFLVNNAAGPDALVESLGRERVLLGFPGAGGQRNEGEVHYMLASSAQPTTLGELDGQDSERLRMIRQIFIDAGLPVTVCSNMDAWLKTHAALVCPLANALYMAGGDNYRLARTRDGIVLLVRAVKEGLRVLRALGIPVTPSAYQVFLALPEPLMVPVLQKRLGRPLVELMAARHANAARDEMTMLATEFRALARRSGVKTPAIDRLYAYTDADVPPAPEGQAEIKLTWGPTIAATGALLSLGLLAAWLLRIKPTARRKTYRK